MSEANSPPSGSSVGEKLAQLAERMHGFSNHLLGTRAEIGELNKALKDVVRDFNAAMVTQAKEANAATAAQAKEFLTALKEQGERHARDTKEQGELNAREMREIRAQFADYVKKGDVGQSWAIAERSVKVLGWIVVSVIASMALWQLRGRLTP